MYHPRNTMESQNNQINVNSVNGNRIRGNPMVVTLGRTRHVQQLASDRHQATVRNVSKIRIGT